AASRHPLTLVVTWSSADEEEGRADDHVGAQQLGTLQPVRAPVQNYGGHADGGQRDGYDLQAAEDEVHGMADQDADEDQKRGHEERDLGRRAERDLHGHVHLVPDREEDRRGMLGGVAVDADYDDAYKDPGKSQRLYRRFQ